MKLETGGSSLGEHGDYPHPKLTNVDNLSLQKWMNSVNIKAINIIAEIYPIQNLFQINLEFWWDTNSKGEPLQDLEITMQLATSD